MKKSNLESVIASVYSYIHLLLQSIFSRCSSLRAIHKNVWMRMLSQHAIKVALSAVYHNSNQGPLMQ